MDFILELLLSLASGYWLLLCARPYSLGDGERKEQKGLCFHEACWEERISKKETNKYTISNHSELYKWAMNAISKIKAEFKVGQNLFFCCRWCLICGYISRSVMSNSLRLCGLWPARLLCPWDSPGKNTGVGGHFLLQGSNRADALSSELPGKPQKYI